MSLRVDQETGLDILKYKYALVIVITALLLASCSSTARAPFPTASNDVSKLAWESCNGGFQCATLKVPIDYNDVSLGEFEIAVLRYRDQNQHDRLGSLVVNPGGPGVSGIEFARNAEFLLNPEILERYDIVGFDPRGVGQSTAIQCLNAKEQDALLSGDPKPDNDAEFAQAITETQSFIDECVEKVPNLAHFSTRDAAHDMELLRQSLGDAKLNYMGFSYGTYLGTLYAQQFPSTVGRFVLDGAIHPGISIEQQSLIQAVAFDKALTNFISACFEIKKCPLPAGATPQFFIDLFSRISNQPLTTTDKTTRKKRQITEGLVVTGTAAALYDDETGWPQLRTAISQALLGDGAGFAQLADGYNGRKSDGTFKDNQNDANIIINCLDWQQIRSNEAIRLASAKFVKLAPVFGPYVAFSGITCNILNRAINRTVITHDQNSAQIENTATPVLIIGTTQDPATPYLWAKALAAYIKGSRLITLRGEGHTGYGRGSACTDDAVDAYLVSGVIPTQNITCTQ
ncbi:MAG: alpha/beta hydrolase [Candidatus Planktophila sp.]|nr:alpha/beta hydrolase [Candidatus Planktophila sp.]